ncbi:UNVERIFIED_CONTAM: hypothetical protein Slati_2862200 [Sesamum latifolium]|uniref:Uncharacterized protein n=1 Tax=Sesamum latifolium TaxID=2727402 RepID=A0AAW2VBJ6_9LAMI
MKLARAAGAKYLEACSDSQLVVNQVRGDFEAIEKRMAQYLNLIRTIGQTFKKFELKCVPRTDNEEADQLAKLASSLTTMKDRSIILLTQEHSEIEEVTREVLVSTNKPCWKDAIKAYLTTGSLPLDKKEARAIRIRAALFTMIPGDLYKRGFSQPYLKCLDPERAEYVLREVHEGSCGNHAGGRSLAGKVLRQGYFWPTMRRDALDMVRCCRKCQEHANIMHVPAAPMQPIPNPCPFDQWGMDLIEKLPRAIGQKECLIVAVDYFLKWVEAEPLSEISEKEHLKARLDEAKGSWVDELPGVIWAYRTTVRQSTGELPFNLIYGTEAVVPAQIGEETLQIQQYKSNTNGVERRADLDLLGEVQNNASVRAEMYKRRMAKAYNTRVRPRNFQVGDLVWRRSDVQGNLEKLDAKWEGPYEVAKTIGSATYKLRKLDGKRFLGLGMPPI